MGEEDVYLALRLEYESSSYCFLLIVDMVWSFNQNAWPVIHSSITSKSDGFIAILHALVEVMLRITETNEELARKGY